LINQKLLTARHEKGWSIEVASARIGVSRVTYSRWENGHQEPQPTVLALLCQAFERNASELGYAHLSREPLPSEARQFQEQPAHPLHMLTEGQLAAFTSLFRQGEEIMFDQKKRETLKMLIAAISLTTVNMHEILQPESWSHILSTKTDQEKVNDATIRGYENLIEACWQFSRGNQLLYVEKLLPECISKLTPLAHQSSKYQQRAAMLVAQGYRIYSILALHKNDFSARELYCKQAAAYSVLARDCPLLISSLKGLGDTYYYGNRYIPALQTYQDMLQYSNELSPLLNSKIYTSLAVAYAHVDQRQDAFHFLGLALDNFPDNPEADSSFSYAEFDHSQLILWEGITRSKLGETSKAFDIFRRIEHPDIIIPERIRVEILNQHAKTSIISGDLEQSAAYVEYGVAGAKALNSQRRYNEAYDNYKQMQLLWPQEKRMKELGELFA